MENNRDEIFSKEYEVEKGTTVDIRKLEPEVSKELISEKYEIEIETKSDEEPKAHEDVSESEIEVDIQKYGIGKPKRVILRGKLIHD